MFEAFDRLYRERTAAAHSPQEEVTQVALSTLEGYFRSHPQTSERIDQINRMITDEHWGNLTSERPLEVAYVFGTARAQRAYAARHYQEAAALAKRSLDVLPAQPLAWRVLAASQFALADFDGAASANRKLLDLAPTNEGYLRAYADSLAARGEPSKGVRELEIWMADHPDATARAVRDVERAGLLLLAHDKAGADARLKELNTLFNGAWPPELAGRLGWWYCRAGNYSAALNHLTQAAQQLPGNATVNTQLGWVYIEQRDFEDALDRFGRAKSSASVRANGPGPERLRFAQPWMGSAVAFWLARQPTEALNDFSFVAEAQPEWLNPRWTSALYSPTVARAVAEMQAEQKKRRSEARPR
jgi:tetratricopeptide (TPR) repeat protein